MNAGDKETTGNLQETAVPGPSTTKQKRATEDPSTSKEDAEAKLKELISAYNDSDRLSFHDGIDAMMPLLQKYPSSVRSRLGPIPSGDTFDNVLWFLIHAGVGIETLQSVYALDPPALEKGNATSIVSTCDDEGRVNFEAFEWIFRTCPSLCRVRDHHGRTPLHHLIKHDWDDTTEQIRRVRIMVELFEEATCESLPLVLQDLEEFLQPTSKPSNLFDKSATAMPVAAIKALLGVVERSKATTMMEMQNELKEASQCMIQAASAGTTANGLLPTMMQQTRSHSIAVSSGCELFLKYITRTFLEELPDFEECRQAVLERGERFAGISLAARDRISVVAADFIQEGHVVLTHGWSRVVASILLRASATKHFDIMILEGRPDAAGARAAQFYSDQANIPCTVVLDSAMGYVMDSVDIVLVGAEGVVENGGIVNKMGTNALATCAQANGKPFYVAAESYKFARLYPLLQRDIPNVGSVPMEFCDTTTATVKRHTTATTKKEHEEENAQKKQAFPPVELSQKVKVENPPCDYTPAKFITLLFTDLGVLTPSAVSDELIRLYQ